MKTFMWKKIYKYDKVKKDKRLVSISLIEILEPGNAIIFWGSVTKINERYRIVAYNADRTLKTVEETIGNINDSMLAIEKFLFDNGIAQEDDTIECIADKDCTYE